MGSYYNGSLVEIDGLRFLALEGPLEKAVSRFFYALLDTNPPLLIRLTPEKENDIERCAPYWKDRLLESGRLAIPRHLGAPKNIDYLATDEWKDNSAANAELLLGLVLQARALYDPSKGPLAVHYSGGVGRTGTFIAAYCLIREIDVQIASGIPVSKLKVSIERLVARLSLQRYHMVARSPQYLNLHYLLKVYLEKYISKPL